MKFSRFESIGVYLPATVQSTQELVATMTNPPMFSIEDITGIKQRRVHGPEEDSVAMAKKAIEECLSKSRWAAHEIDVVISASISRVDEARQYYEPSLALSLARHIGARNAIHFDVSNACAGMMTGVYILDRMIKAGLVRNGIVVSGEAITPIARTATVEISQPWDPQFGSLTVGDSAAAVLVDESTSEADRIHYIELITSAEYSHLCIGMPSEQRPQPALYTNNAEMHKKERTRMWPKFFKAFLDEQGKSFEDENFDYIVQHQVGAKAISNFCRVGEELFQVPMPPALSVVEELGNTSTTSHFLVMHRHLKNKVARAGAKWLMIPAASGVITGFLSATISTLGV